MKKLLMTLCAIALFGFTPTAAAQDELPSCDELAELADALEDLRDAFEEADDIREGDEVDQILGDVVTALEDIAAIERDKKLTRAVKSLASAWNDMDHERFGLSLDSVITNFDGLYRTECE